MVNSSLKTINFGLKSSTNHNQVDLCQLEESKHSSCFQGLNLFHKYQDNDLLINLKQLKLDGNTIEYLDDYTFASLKNLESMSLRNNKLRRLTEKTFSGNVSLQYLDLNGNMFQQIDPILFAELSNLIAVPLYGMGNGTKKFDYSLMSSLMSSIKNFDFSSLKFKLLNLFIMCI